GPLAEPHDIGCTARVVRVENLDGGRMNILALGEQRFRIHELDRELEYLRGEVEYRPVSAEDSGVLERAGLGLQPWVMRYLQVLHDADLISNELNTLPADPIELANMGAFLLQVPPEQKQILLAAEDGVQFVKATCRVFRREVTLLDNFLLDDEPLRERTAALN
ncbi:MAG: LON peptidase substrate-binding domain-containing protein, partial [Anaerolineae bacterium]|nr:LON peptidase substrate-binding domain-containing protein [Anaerolineae bacterium]